MSLSHGGLWLLLLAGQLSLRTCPPGAELHLTLLGEGASEPVGEKIRQGVKSIMALEDGLRGLIRSVP